MLTRCSPQTRKSPCLQGRSRSVPPTLPGTTRTTSLGYSAVGGPRVATPVWAAPSQLGRGRWQRGVLRHQRHYRSHVRRRSRRLAGLVCALPSSDPLRGVRARRGRGAIVGEADTWKGCGETGPSPGSHDRGIGLDLDDPCKGCERHPRRRSRRHKPPCPDAAPPQPPLVSRSFSSEPSSFRAPLRGRRVVP